MPCVRPLTAYYGPSGAVVFVAAKSKTRVPFKLPCGRCIGCRLERARQWGLRCLHEAKQWPRNSYVTLTYNDDSLPPGGSLSLEDVQLFLKRLRKAREPWRVRYFAGGEYGGQFGRAHYHLLLFNVGFRDRKLHSYNKRGEPLYTSEELDRLWYYQGHATIGEVTFDSAVYCAKYCIKKVNGALADDYYAVFDSDGVVSRRRPEFGVMSRKPAIGAGYYDKFGSEVRDHDNVVIGGREVKPPRYYDKRTELVDSAVYDRLKRKRKRLAVLNKHDNTEERLRVKETLMVLAAQHKERNV